LAPAVKRKISREELAPGECLCDYCSAKCCKYFALPLETPTTRQDFDYLRWYLLHDAATVFIEEETWYLLVHTACKHLQADNRCGIYATRPQICRDYSTHNCEYEDSWVYDHYFETPEQIEEYVEAVLQEPQASIRGRRPELLPVLGDV
jgi:Fe-S-cluster containining protein